MNIGYLFALVATFSWAISAFIFTALSNRIPVFYVNLLRLIFSTILLLMLSIVIDGQAFFILFNSSYWQNWLWIGFSGFIAFYIGDDFIFKCYSTIGPQKGSLLTSLSPALTLLVGIPLLGESVNSVGIIGIAITIAGTMYISLGRVAANPANPITKATQLKAVGYGIIAAACHGIGIACSKKGIIDFATQGIEIQPISAAFIRILFAAIPITVVYFFVYKKSLTLNDIFANNRNNQLLSWGTLFNPTLGVIMSMYAIANINVAVAQTFFSLVPLFTLFIVLLHFKEKITTRSVLGIGFALIGVIVLIWRQQIQLFFSAFF